MKMTKWHAHIVYTAKHMTMVGGPSLVGGPGPGPLSPLNQALECPLNEVRIIEDALYWFCKLTP